MRLTCKEKVDREQKGQELPSGIVKWFVEVFDTNVTDGKIPETEAEEKEALVCIATILTMVQKKQTTFTEITDEVFENSIAKLEENQQPLWGEMSPQHMVEHLETSYRIASGEIQDFEIATPEKYLEDTRSTLWNYKKMPKNYNFPLYKEGELFELEHSSLNEAKEKLKESRKEYIEFFKRNPNATLKNAVFGELTKYEWGLLERKHLNHHFSQFELL